MIFFNREISKGGLLALLLLFTGNSKGIEIVLDFTMDEQNHNYFNPSTSLGQERRESLQSAAGFLSKIITNDDWNSALLVNRSLTFYDIYDSRINDMNGNLVAGIPETDGDGYWYSIPITNRSNVGANQFVVYVGVFKFDDGTSAHAKGGWFSGSPRNAAGIAGTAFNTWGGRIYFDIDSQWYSGLNPGVDPTDDYGFQDPNKFPSTDISSDNWDWHTGLNEWKGFKLNTVDPWVGSQPDLYAVGLHEILHALGLTSSNFANYIGTDFNGNAIGEHLVAEYGGPVPLTGGHFDYGTQSEVWRSDGIIAETVLDPSSTNGNRKYLTRLDVAALSDLGYLVADCDLGVAPAFDVTMRVVGRWIWLDWPDADCFNYVVHWSTDMETWNEVPVGNAGEWRDPISLRQRKYYYVTREDL